MKVSARLAENVHRTGVARTDRSDPRSRCACSTARSHSHCFAFPCGASLVESVEHYSHPGRHENVPIHGPAPRSLTRRAAVGGTQVASTRNSRAPNSKRPELERAEPNK